MCELLPQLGGEAEASGHLRGPRARGVLIRRPIERAVDLDGVEEVGVVRQLVLVGEFGGVEEVVPGALALGVTPTRGPDVDRHRGSLFKNKGRLAVRNCPDVTLEYEHASQSTR